MSLHIEDLTVSYGKNDVLRSLDLDVGTGERFAIMGPSGSGKSSLIRAVAGIAPCSGTVIVNGTNVSSLPPHQRPVGLMFQDYALFPHLTVADNVAYGLKMTGVDKPEREARVAEMLERVGLHDFGRRSVASLSGGEQQRVALARTLAPEPSLVMLDEPLGSLDFALRESLLEHMRTVVTELGTTTIYVTHDRGEAFSFADRVAILIDGQIAALGTPEGLWRSPGTVSVARLIGHQTVIESSAVGLEGWHAIPPEAVALAPDGPLHGVVAGSTFADGTFLTTVNVNGTTLRLHTPQIATEGTQLRLMLDPALTIPLAES